MAAGNERRVPRDPGSIWIWIRAIWHRWTLWNACRKLSVASMGIKPNAKGQAAVFLGEVIGRYLNDWIMNLSIKRNGGVFEAESRLWCVALIICKNGHVEEQYRACYIAVPLYICGFVVVGAAFENHLSIGALVMGWGIAECA